MGAIIFLVCISSMIVITLFANHRYKKDTIKYKVYLEELEEVNKRKKRRYFNDAT